MDLGTGILAGCAVIGGIIGTVKLIPNNKYVPQKNFNMLNQTMEEGFKDLKLDIREIHKRIDKILER